MSAVDQLRELQRRAEELNAAVDQLDLYRARTAQPIPNVCRCRLLAILDHRPGCPAKETT